ncbi:Leucine-rich repeat receptor protein kinase msp1 [Thalictrum thalictroides]|uniref:Leucine-rich repeat receptor protein kinase msp1 n=1 Tax=Thalictrum thalictroides TaxID=46969 RepID=A0A7J6VS11_THATH|nr:Leucine-rich repeat receptor protein kinase msp1 [Thalictrum thalictroides]
MALAFTSATHHLALVLLLLVTVLSPLCFAKCHVDDEAGLLAFKSGITHDPSGFLSSWIPGTDCCRWSNIHCINTDRVTDLIIYGDTTNPNGSLTGTISPSLFIKVRQLSRISIQDHPNITGTLPKEMFNLPRLQFVTIKNTKLSGLLRIDIGPKSDRFQELSLSANQFTGSIPNSISQFTHLTALDLNDNKIYGGIPYGIRRLTKLTHLALKGNQLSGGIPDIFNSFALIELDLSYNKLSGGIPPSFSSLAPQLQFFRASHNALTGRIPAYLSNFKQLDGLDLSYNRLSGPIPTTKFPAESFIGNDGLCGSPLPPCKKY